MPTYIFAMLIVFTLKCHIFIDHASNDSQ